MFFSALVVAATLAVMISAQVPTMILDCNSYPDVCDNHCNAAFCHGFNNPNAFLHYDPNSSSDRPNPNTRQTAATLRRQAIGCGSRNYCPSGTDCDEVPYASTYDGGLGCIVARYTGGDPIAQSGTTRCADPGENGRHGAALGNFYAAQGLGDGDRFQVGNDASIMNAPLCADIFNRGDAACPDESTGPYRFRSTPAAESYCPPRGIFRRQLAEIQTNKPPQKRTKAHKLATTDGGRDIRLLFGPKLEVGASVWMLGANGTGIEEKIVSVSDEE